MRFSFPFLLALMVLGFVAAFLIRRATASRSRVTEPSCGKCGYCVRGLESLVCPECGSDLREVGIITPGATRPMGTGAKLLLWTGLAIAPALIFAQALAPRITPYTATATRSRTIFVQAPTVNCTIQVKQFGTMRKIGRPAFNTPITAQSTMLTLGSRSNTMGVDLLSGAAQFTDPAGAVIKGTFDAPFIARWLNAFGLTAPAVAERAKDVFAGVEEMKDGGGGGFSRYAPNPQRGNLCDVTAHPATPPIVISRPTPFGQTLPFVLMGVFWLAGLPFVLRRSRVQSRRDADQA